MTWAQLERAGLSSEYTLNYPSLPDEKLIKMALDLKVQGHKPFILCICGIWFLLREPMLKEIKAYESALTFRYSNTPNTIQKLTNPWCPEPPYENVIQPTTIKWLIDKCTIVPQNVDWDKMVYFPGIPLVLIRTLLKNYTLGVREVAERCQESQSKTRSIIEVLAAKLKVFDIDVDTDQMPISVAIDKIAIADSIVDEKRALLTSSSPQQAQPPPPRQQRSKNMSPEQEQMLEQARELLEMEMKRHD